MSKETPHLGTMIWTDANGNPRPMYGSIEAERRQKLYDEDRKRALATPEGQAWLANSPCSPNSN